MRKNKPVSTRRSSFSLAAMLVGICLSFLGIIFISVIYIAKDYYAYNSVYAFFGIDSQTLLWLMGLPVGQKTLLRLLNFSHACFIVCSVMFAMSFSSLLPERVARFLGWLIGAIWLVQVVFLDPQFLSWLYMERIGVFDNVRFFRGFYRWLVRLLRWFSVGWILFAAGLLVGAFFRTPASLRTGTALVALLFSCLAFLYIYLFSWLPVQALWMSRVADYIRFESLPIYKPTAFNIYARTLTFLLMGLFFFAAAWMILKNSRNSRYDRIFRSKVSAVDVVSRVFCHYLKNELLSQQAELKLLEVKVQPELKEDVRFIMQRNDDIYRRLTTVRETMKQKKTVLGRLELTELLRKGVDGMNIPEGVELRLRLPDELVWVCCNREQMIEVLQCLIQNALESDRDEILNLIDVHLEVQRRYASIVVSNDGPRIDKDQWNQIFDPFFSTKPAQRNWGLGLALCRNIVTLHKGRIWMDEQTIDGKVMTSFHILLPLAR